MLLKSAIIKNIEFCLLLSSNVNNYVPAIQKLHCPLKVITYTQKWECHCLKNNNLENPLGNPFEVPSTLKLASKRPWQYKGYKGYISFTGKYCGTECWEFQGHPLWNLSTWTQCPEPPPGYWDESRIKCCYFCSFSFSILEFKI